ncbi:MAG: ChaN family lipoprotein [Bacteroidota bacterium]
MNQKLSFLILSLICIWSHSLLGQVDGNQAFKIFDVELGQEISLEKLRDASSEFDVLFWGEEHDDSLGHILQDSLYHLLLNRYNTVALSMEMFETDGQYILDEYLDGLITEEKFLSDARPWATYERAYRPLLERAKEGKQAVIAANAPRRYVSMVSRNGLGELEKLSKTAKAYLPPLPIYTEDKDYKDRFDEIMSQSPHSYDPKIFHAQCTWDASMSFRIYKHWKKNKGELIFHLNGRFHTDYKLGTFHQLQRLNKKLRIANISCFPVENFEKINWSEHADKADFIIVSKKD